MATILFRQTSHEDPILYQNPYVFLFLDCINSLEKVILVLVFVVLPMAVIIGYVLYRYKNTGTFTGSFDCFKITGKR